MSNIKDKTIELKLKLKKRGLKLRKDSALCSLYIESKTDLDIDYIVQRMCEMNYLYEYCDMKNIKTKVYNEYLNNGCTKNYEENISSYAEKIALEKYSGGTYPMIFPWEINTLDKFDKKYNDEEEFNSYGINVYGNAMLVIIGCYFFDMMFINFI